MYTRSENFHFFFFYYYYLPLSFLLFGSARILRGPRGVQRACVRGRSADYKPIYTVRASIATKGLMRVYMGCVTESIGCG